MRPFEYIRPSTVGEASRILTERGDGAFAIGGGSAAVVMLRLGVVRPECVVDLGGVAALRGLEANGALRIGALTPIRALELDESIRARWGLLAEAASQVANVRVRNAATVGGAVAYGEPQTDTPTALAALSATVRIAGATPDDARAVPIDEFYLGPYETVLAPGEIVAGIDVPAPPPHTGGAHMKFTIGSPENKPVANASALATLDPATGKCVAARVVMGAAGPTPVAAQAAEGLIGDFPTPERIAEIAAAAAEESDPMEDLRGPVWHKRRVLKVLTERALLCATQRAQA